MFAQQTQTEITDLQNLSNGKTYTLVAKRGFIGVKESKAIFGYAGTPDLTRPQTDDDRFAILKHEEKYYLFNSMQVRSSLSTWSRSRQADAILCH